MISIVPEELSYSDAYRLLISVVVPRPIAWVSTVGSDGVLNLAPFSFFNAVGGTPPTVMYSVGRRRGDNPLKDSLRNAKETGEFVLNLVDESLAEQMNETSAEVPYEVDEFELSGLAMTPSVDVKPPRVAQARVAMEARVTQIVPVEGTPNTMVLGRVVRYHVSSGLLRPNYLVDDDKLRPVARLGGDEYATLGRVFAMKRPG